MMDNKSRSDLRQVLEDWERGIPVRVLRLGHGSHIRQDEVYGYVFALMKILIDETIGSHEAFLALCDISPPAAVIPGSSDPQPDLTDEELGAAHSLVWRVFHSGWDHALTGFPNAQYTSVERRKTAA
jgi:hypothetical protein